MRVCKFYLLFRARWQILFLLRQKVFVWQKLFLKSKTRKTCYLKNRKGNMVFVLCSVNGSNGFFGAGIKISFVFFSFHRIIENCSHIVFTKRLNCFFTLFNLFATYKLLEDCCFNHSLNGETYGKGKLGKRITDFNNGGIAD